MIRTSQATRKSCTRVIVHELSLIKLTLAISPDVSAGGSASGATQFSIHVAQHHRTPDKIMPQSDLDRAPYDQISHIRG